MCTLPKFNFTNSSVKFVAVVFISAPLSGADIFCVGCPCFQVKPNEWEAGCGGLIVAVRDRVSRFLDRECVGLSVSNTAYQPGVYGPPQHLIADQNVSGAKIAKLGGRNPQQYGFNSPGGR
jgi:hypothetical protein